MTKRSPILLLGAAVFVAALVLCAFIIPALQPEGTSADLGVAFYDSDGNPVGAPMAFVGPAGEVEDIVISLSYTVTSTEERFEENLEVWGNVLIEWMANSPDASSYTTAFDLPIAESRLATNTYSWSYDLREIISIDETGKTYGWTVRITATLTSSMVSDGETVTSDPWTETVSFTLAWESEMLVITGSVGWL